MLDEWMLFWRDVGQAGGDAAEDALRNAEYAAWVRSVAADVEPRDVHAQMRALADTSRWLDQNVNARLALDVLLLKLPQVSAR
jgi:hypothetical protein